MVELLIPTTEELNGFDVFDFDVLLSKKKNLSRGQLKTKYHVKAFLTWKKRLLFDHSRQSFKNVLKVVRLELWKENENIS